MNTMVFCRRAPLRWGLLVLLPLLAGCIAHNDHALNIGGPPVVEGETISSIRAIQTRNFDTLETAKLVQASAATLQDLGFSITTVSPEFGVLSGSKQRDAVETGQVAVQFALVIIAALAGSQHHMVYDESQQINVTLVVNKASDNSSAVRVFFDRHITNNYGDLWKAEVIKEHLIYQEFFEKLSKSVFLEAHKI